MRFTVFVVTNLPIYFKLFSHCALNAAVGYEPHQCNQNIQRTCNPLHHKGNRNSNGIQQDGYPREVIEHALAHQLKDKAEAAYARGTLFDKRRHLMDDWATYCNTVKKAEGDNIVPIRKGKTA